MFVFLIHTVDLACVLCYNLVNIVEKRDRSFDSEFDWNGFMSKVFKQTASIVLMAVIVFSAFAGLTFNSGESADAAGYPTGYPNTYKNTGMGATDIVGVARTQIGYKENGVGTKYGYWYIPSFVDQPWCAMFVSWCAAQAKIPQTVVTRFAACTAGMNWFRAQKRWYDSKYFGGKYTPVKGDIVFYSDMASQSVSTHVGIVAGVKGNYLDVIEGNSTNASVCEYTNDNSRTLGSSYVIGYGHPNYSRTAAEEPTKYEVWQVSVDSLNMRKSASTSSALVTSMTYGTELNVKKFSVKDDYIWGYTTYKSKSGWVALDYCDYIYGNIDGVYYQLKPKVSPKTVTLYLDYTKKLTATNGLGGKYSSSDKTIAKVNSKGKITALKKGTAKIKLKTSTGTATCTVTVKNPSISKKTAQACKGDSCTLSVKNTKSTPQWSSSDKTIAKVDSKGKVTALKEGTAVITAKVSGVNLKCNFTVTKYPTTYERFTTSKEANLKTTYTNKRKNIVLIPKGVLLKVTKVQYTDKYSFGYTSYNGMKGWVIINHCKYVCGTIGNKCYLVRPYLKETSKSLYLNEPYKIKLQSPDAKTKFTSADTKIAKVNSSGEITALKAGKTQIAVKSGDANLSFNLTVKKPTLSAKSAGFLKGKTMAVAVQGGYGDIKWSTSDKNVATVNGAGEITAVSYGKAKITATINDLKLNCNISVYDPILSDKSATVKEKETKTLKVSQHGGDIISWKSADKKIATVTSKGVVKGIKAGKTTVTATVDGITLSCKINVKAAS